MHASKKVPAYAAVRDRLLHKVRSGQWPHGALIPGEVELAQELEVSVGTVRRALDDLVSARLLQRTRRKGTSVTSHTQEMMRDGYFHVVRRADHDKALPRHRLLHFSSVAAAAWLGRVFKDEPVVHLAESLVELHGNAVLYDFVYIPASMAPDLTRDLFGSRPSSAFALYQQRYGATVVSAAETVEAVRATARVARALKVESGSPLLEIQRTARGFDGQVIEFRRRLLSTKQHVYLHGMGEPVPVPQVDRG